MVDMAHIAGLVAAGLHPAPIPYADIVTSTTHKTLRGPRGGLILCNQELGHIIDSSIFPGLQGGPLEHIVAAKAVAFNEALKPKFVTYQKAVLDNASLLAELLQNAGLRIVSGSTKNHMFLADLTPMGITGRAAEEALEKSGIIANRNAIPFDTRPPQVASGLRFGTPAITTRGFASEEVQQVADFIIRVLTHLDDHSIQEEIRQEVENICKKFPIPGYEA